MKANTFFTFLLCNFFTQLILAQGYTNLYTVKADLDPLL